MKNKNSNKIKIKKNKNINLQELYKRIKLGKSYDFWTFVGYAGLITIKEDNKNVYNMKQEAERKGWVWFLYKDDPIAHPLHKKLIIIEKGYKKNNEN